MICVVQLNFRDVGQKGVEIISFVLPGMCRNSSVVVLAYQSVTGAPKIEWNPG